MEILQNTFYGNTIINWTISISLVIFSFVLGKIALWIFKSIFKKVTAQTKSIYDDIFIDMAEEPVVAIIVATGVYFGILRLTLPHMVDKILHNAYQGVLIIMVTWFLARSVKALIKNFIIPFTSRTKNDLDDQLLPILEKGINSGIWVLGIIVALNNAGFNVGAIIAGMGIGGLALAMAAKDTVSNFFGGMTIFIDKPFKLYDRIKVGGYDGTVIEIGIRTTRLRTLEGRIVTIPNTFFTATMVENVSLEPTRKIISNLGLTYDTTPQELESAISSLKKIVKNHPSTENNILISFNQFGDFALNILLIYYIKRGEDIFEVQTDINLEILKVFNENQHSFAFPTQTLEILK